MRGQENPRWVYVSVLIKTGIRYLAGILLNKEKLLYIRSSKPSKINLWQFYLLLRHHNLLRKGGKPSSIYNVHNYNDQKLHSTKENYLALDRNESCI